MDNYFITNVNINNVRNLEKIDIPLSDNEKKHLILTGKNGSGKTTVLNSILQFLNILERGANLLYLTQQRNSLQNLIDRKKQLENQLHNQGEQKNNSLLNQLESVKTSIQNVTNNINNHGVELDFNTINNLNQNYQNGKFIISYFDAKRNVNIIKPDGIKKININNRYNASQNPGNIFIQYLVNLKAKSAFAETEGDPEISLKIDEWFEMFEKSLQDIFEDGSLKLKFDYNNYNFNIIQNEKETFNLNTLSDGYSAILSIITDIIIRMENNRTDNYDVQGIVLIDEIETHLHVSLQKKILPFLTSFFPNIQFIVTTHSPFILSSISNTVIYDLENKILVNDLSAYSYQGIIEGYFDIDQYSNIIKDKFDRYEELINKHNRAEDEEDDLLEIKSYLKEIPDFLAPELKSKFYEIELNKRSEVDD